MSIKINYDNKDYTLEFTKESIRKMERMGFRVMEYGNAPVTDSETLFAGSFLARHPEVKRATIMEIFDEIPNRGKLLQRLFEMYLEQATGLQNDESGKAKWEEA